MVRSLHSSFLFYYFEVEQVEQVEHRRKIKHLPCSTSATEVEQRRTWRGAMCAPCHGWTRIGLVAGVDRGRGMGWKRVASYKPGIKSARSRSRARAMTSAIGDITYFEGCAQAVPAVAAGAVVRDAPQPGTAALPFDSGDPVNCDLPTAARCRERVARAVSR